jgi:hypothetical protein
MSCGCQKRAASNGASACSSCVTALEAKLKAEKTATARTASTVQRNATSQTWGADRYNK